VLQILFHVIYILILCVDRPFDKPISAHNTLLMGRPCKFVIQLISHHFLNQIKSGSNIYEVKLEKSKCLLWKQTISSARETKCKWTGWDRGGHQTLSFFPLSLSSFSPPHISTGAALKCSLLSWGQYHKAFPVCASVCVLLTFNSSVTHFGHSIDPVLPTVRLCVHVCERFMCLRKYERR